MNNAEDFINDTEIKETIKLVDENKNNKTLIAEIFRKAEERKGLDHREASLLLHAADSEQLFALAKKIKAEFYGNRVVLFAPLYLSNYCDNGCVYCPYNKNNKKIHRKKLTQDEIRAEVIALQDMGHKRLAVESGESAEFSPIEYITESIDTIYKIKHKNGAIRRVNVNIAATTVENYKELKKADIGTYILFQETYQKEIYNKLHPSGPKSDYAFHTEAMDRAMQAGINDVGIGVLFGLGDYRYDFCAMMMHAEHLEAAYGVGPHTISVPRIRPAEGVSTDRFIGAIDDETLSRIVACIRISAPYTGIIVSTRESAESRERLLNVGVSQISGGSRTSVGGYEREEEKEVSTKQFEVKDSRTLAEVVTWLMETGHIPSFCTACYREGRVGDRFMSLAKAGQIQSICLPNALMTLEEYLLDYSDEKAKILGEKIIADELKSIPNAKVRGMVAENLEKIKKGSRDFRL